MKVVISASVVYVQTGFWWVVIRRLTRLGPHKDDRDAEEYCNSCSLMTQTLQCSNVNNGKRSSIKDVRKNTCFPTPTSMSAFVRMWFAILAGVHI